MPRRHRRKPDESPQPPRRPATTSPIPAPAGWEANRYHGGPEGPDYVCPRCKRGVRRGSEHVVAKNMVGDELHRHWHTECWRSAVREGIEKYRWG